MSPLQENSNRNNHMLILPPDTLKHSAGLVFLSLLMDKKLSMLNSIMLRSRPISTLTQLEQSSEPLIPSLAVKFHQRTSEPPLVSLPLN